VAVLLPFAAITAPAAGAPVQVMTAPASAPVTSVEVAALPSGQVVLAKSGAALRYSARAGARWTPPRSLHPLFTSGSDVSAVQRGDRWLLSWLGRGNQQGTRSLVFADFRGARRPPEVHRIFTKRAMGDPVAVPGAHAGARGVWPVLNKNQLFEGGTDPVGNWETKELVPGELISKRLAVAQGPGASRLVVWGGRQDGLDTDVWASAEPGENLPPPRALYAPPTGTQVVQRAAAFRPSGDAAALLLTAADGPQFRLEAVSIEGNTAGAPRLVDSGHRIPTTEPPQVASLPDGRLVAVWRRVAAARVQLVVANERTPGGEWTAPLVISPADQRPGTPNLVITGSGQPAVSWSDGRRVFVRALRVGPRVTGGGTAAVSGSHLNCRRPAAAASGKRTVTMAFACEAGRKVYLALRALPRG
jgi:hypothetical protein